MVVIQNDNEIVLVIDYDAINRYAEQYFAIHTRAKKKPIARPYHESINQWMIMRRSQMNALKQKWKDFIKWFVEEQGYANLRIQKCEICQTIYYPTNRRHDIDNSVPKFILDGLVESKMIVDDDMKHITRLTMECGVDSCYPRTVLKIKVYEFEYDGEDIVVPDGESLIDGIMQMIADE